jgi:hypothetical protein
MEGYFKTQYAHTPSFHSFLSRLSSSNQSQGLRSGSEARENLGEILLPQVA